MSQGLPELLSEFTTATDSLVTYDQWDLPSIGSPAKSAATRVAAQIGQLDASRNHPTPTSLPLVLPSQISVREHIDQAAEMLGTKAWAAMATNFESRLIVPPPAIIPPSANVAPEITAEPEHKRHPFLEFLNRHKLTILLVAVVMTIEFLIGVEVSNIVFNMTDTAARIMAFAMPFVFMAAGMLLAWAIDTKWKGHSESAFVGFAITAFVFVVIFIINAGLVISGVVGHGVTNTLDPNQTSEEDVTFRLVKFVAYLAVMLAIAFAVAALHLLERISERRKQADQTVERAIQEEQRKITQSNRDKALQVRDDAFAAANEERARIQSDPQMVRKANLRHLERFINVYEALMDARDDIAGAYVAGALQNLSPAAAAVWPQEGFFDRPADDPDWVAQLRTYIDQAHAEATV
jgi:hypothetical protein